jgi:phospholipid-binding lipoprotein MlaA
LLLLDFKVMRLALRPIFLLSALALIGLTACTNPTDEQRASGEPFDPNERSNRKMHQFNLGVDKVIFRPASTGYTSVIPDPIIESVGSFAENLSMPRVMVNGLLQGDLKTAGIALSRFVINTTVGFAGLADVATNFEIPQVDADFGQTLHVWGFKEGAYLELPFFGPSNERDAAGLVMDLLTNPLTYYVHNPIDNAGVFAEVLDRMGDRGRYSATVDSILYESADSYAQARLIYLQNRRFELAGSGDDAYSDPYTDVYADPYEDPYAE